MPQITVHQTLHGYRDGHQLISASIDLDRPEAATMQVMSDLSGPAFQRGFETYLTAYPLANSGLFCLARTWFAPELHRPGCVWTHSILINFEDLAGVPDIRSLFRIFRRPESVAPAFGAYQARLEVSLDEPSSPTIDLAAAAAIMRGIYESHDRVVVPCDDSETYETVVASIFSQQWPRLRRTFRFCTGALSLRDSDFDISVSPPTVTQGVSKGTMVLRLPHQVSETENAPWIAAATNDLAKSTSSELRSFLWRYGSQFADGRAAYAALVGVFQAIEKDANSPESIVSVVVHLFPQASSAALLKSELFGKNGKIAASGAESRLIRALIANPLAQAISDSGLELKARAQILAQSRFEDATELAELALERDGHHAEVFLEGYLDYCQSNPELLATVPLQMLLKLFARDHSVAEQVNSWRRQPNDQISLAYAASREKIHLLNVTSAILQANALPALEVMIRNVGADAVEALLRSVQASESDGLVVATPGVMGALRTHVAELPQLVSSSRLSGPALLLVAATVDPRSQVFRSIGPSSWLPATRGGIRLANAAEDMSARAFLLNLGLATRDPASLELLACSFSSVLNAFDAGTLSSTLWWAIEPSLPWSYFLTRRQRLIRAVVQSVVDCEASPLAFAAVFSTAGLAQDARRELGYSRGGARLASSITQAVRSGEIGDWAGAVAFYSDN